MMSTAPFLVSRHFLRTSTSLNARSRGGGCAGPLGEAFYPCDRPPPATTDMAGVAAIAETEPVMAAHPKYRRLEKIGQGTYGVVYKAVCSNEDDEETVVALKKVRLDDDGNGVPWNAIREVASLKHLQHPHIVTLLDIVLEDKVMWLAFEFLQEDLWSYLKNSAPEGLSFATSREYLRQLLGAVDYCHRNQILHRDVKPGNVLLDGRGSVKLADFGMARPVRNGLSSYSPRLVTIWYRPPELLLDEVFYTTSVDVWSLGCVFVEMTTGHPLFLGDSDIDQLYRIFGLLGTPEEDIWPNLSKSLNFRSSMLRFERQPFESVAPKMNPMGHELCESMLALRPSDRISASQALLHPLFRDSDDA